MDRHKIVAHIAFVVVMVSTAQAMPPVDSYLGMNQCELIAKDFQKEHGGSIIYIQPLDENGAYEMGGFSGHLLNKVMIGEHGYYYIDYRWGVMVKSENEVKKWYFEHTGKDSIIYDLSKEVPGWFRWNY